MLSDLDYPGATTGKDLIATAFFAHSTDLVQRAAAVLGKQDDAAGYATLVPQIKAAFQKEFVTAMGRVGENTQTAYALALQFDLLPEDLRAQAAGRLATEVRTRGHLTTGFVGTPYLCHVLTRYGHLDAFNVRPGQRVKRGDVIAFSGNTGRSTAPHLHYEVWVNDQMRNPIEFIIDEYRSFG